MLANKLNCKLYGCVIIVYNLPYYSLVVMVQYNIVFYWMTLCSIHISSLHGIFHQILMNEPFIAKLQYKFACIYISICHNPSPKTRIFCWFWHHHFSPSNWSTILQLTLSTESKKFEVLVKTYGLRSQGIWTEVLRHMDWGLKAYGLRSQGIWTEVLRHMDWGLKAYGLRSWGIWTEVSRHMDWGLKAYGLRSWGIWTEVSRHMDWGLKTYGLRSQGIWTEVSRHMDWGLKAYGLRSQGIWTEV